MLDGASGAEKQYGLFYCQGERMMEKIVPNMPWNQFKHSEEKELCCLIVI